MKLLILFLFISSTTIGQTTSQQYLFYLHAQVITELGDNAINRGAPEWGPYEYSAIIDSLRKRGFNIISEIRQKGIANSLYIEKIAKQIDSLLTAGTKPGNIVVVGASSGWDIVLHVSSAMKNNDLNFVMMGGCWPETYKDYTDLELYGHFLSIIEKSDPHGTCYKIFENKKQLKSHKEIILNTGLSHGFFYKGRSVWIDPIIEWFQHKFQ